MNRGDEIAGLILAAGESNRMGKDKALLRYQGLTFLEVIVKNVREAGIERIAVVLGHHAELIQREANLSSVQVVLNPFYKSGQTSSLQAGLRALLSPELEAVLLCLVDHPRVSSAAMHGLVEAFRESQAPAAVAVFRGQPGHPVVIGRALFNQLLELAPGVGANQVMRRHRPEMRWVEVSDPGILADIDKPEDYEQLVESG